METNEAVRRVHEITKMLRMDVRTAILSHEVMEATNDVVPKGLAGIRTTYVDTYGAIQNALALKLAMDLGRIFDVTVSERFPVEGQDKASVQVLAALLARDDVREHLVSKAAHWFLGIANLSPVGNAPPELVAAAISELEQEHRNQDAADCENAIVEFLALSARLNMDQSEEAVALARVRQFRNRRLAHSLFDKEPDEYPRFSDLSTLLRVAITAAKFALLAVEGQNSDFEDIADEQRRNAEGFARNLVHGLKLSASREAHRLRQYRIRPRS